MGVPGIMMFMQNPPPIRLEATLSKAQYQFVLQSPDTDELYRTGRRLRDEAARPADAAGCDQRPADQEPAGQPGYRPRPGRRPGRHAPSRSRTPSTPPTAPGRSPPSIPPPTSTRWSWSWSPSTSWTRLALGLLYVRSGTGQLVPLSSLAHSEKRAGAAVGQPSRPDHRRDHLLQPQAGRPPG